MRSDRFEQKPYLYAGRPEAAGRELKNPLPRDMKTLKRGQKMFNTFCIVCHGPFGDGDGSIIPKFPKPPSLQASKIENYPDGRIYHIITEGQNVMPSYASQILPRDRWAIIHYLRALYRAKHASSGDVQKAEEM